VNWSFRQFAEKTIATAGTPVAQAEVWMGARASVGLVPAKDMNILLPALTRNELQAEVVYSGPIRAPIAKGDQLAELVFQPEGLPEMRLPLVAEDDVSVGGFPVRVMTAANVLIKRFLNGPGTEE